jgi:peptide/nickel transport system substrate-binding protein
MKKQKMSKKQMAQTHPYIPEAYDKLQQGKMSRRSFLRMATLLGLSAGASCCG